MPEPALHIWEPEFIQLWQQGASYKAIAQALGCPIGTVASRSAALAAQGKIHPRQRGGAYPSRRVKARPEASPAQAPATPPADSALPTRDPPAITFMAVPEVRELIHTVKDLVARVDIEQWTVRLSKALIARIKAEAAAAEKPPSHLLEELAWKALNDQSPSRP